jgi:hypothetical protein
MELTDKHVGEITAYIQTWDAHLDDHFGTVDVAGKRLLVIGSGWGSEVLWALKRGAAEVVGIDPLPADRRFVAAALAEQGLDHLAGDRFQLHQGTALSVGDLGTFDLIISNNTVEHIFDLAANLGATRRFIPDVGGRFHVFTDPLYLSSVGHHLPIGPWEHLSEAQEAIRARVNSRQWREYRRGLNGMTITDFLQAVREAGLILLDLSISPDRHLDRFDELRRGLPPGIKPMDLCLSGIRCTLAFPHNL